MFGVLILTVVLDMCNPDSKFLDFWRRGLELYGSCRGQCNIAQFLRLSFRTQHLRPVSLRHGAGAAQWLCFGIVMVHLRTSEGGVGGLVVLCYGLGSMG